jgi:hypothetical protein
MPNVWYALPVPDLRAVAPREASLTSKIAWCETDESWKYEPPEL